MILASIITFNPDIDLLIKNIQSISPQVDKVLVIDNYSFNRNKIISVVEVNFKNVHFILNGKNLGVAEALNQVLNYAQKNNYDWVLTLDQDSVCEDDMVFKYKEFLNRNIKQHDILILCPQIEDINIKNNNEENFGVEVIPVTITSGSFLNVDNALRIGGFLSKLFIDYVDFEFCLRGKANQLKTIRLKNVILKHRLGEIKEKRLLGYNLVVTNHSPIRRYYLFRNKIFVYRKYWKKFGPWVIKNILSSIKTILIILIFEKNRVEKFKNIFKGIKDGFFLQIND